MNRFYACLLFIIFHSVSYAQQIEITEVFPTICLNAVYDLPVNITGQFNANNAFKVEIQPGENNVAVTLPAVFQDGKLRFTVPGTAIEKPTAAKLRIVSTSPVVTSQWNSSTRLLDKGNVTLTAMGEDTVNRYDNLPIRLLGRSNSYCEIILSNGQMYSSSTELSHPVLDLTPILLPATPEVLTINSAKNGCGPMATDGKVSIGINTHALRTTFIGPIYTCPGTDIKVNASFDGGVLPATMRYKIRITESGTEGQVIPGARYYDLPATIENNQLTARIPDDFKVSRRTFFTAKVVTENPFNVGSPGSVVFAITPKPQVKLTVLNPTTIEPGKSVFIKYTYTGPFPASITLNDGSQIYETTVFDDSISSTIERMPSKTTDYTAVSVESGCGVHPMQNQKAARVTVKDGLVLSGMRSPDIYCEGETVRLKYTSNVAVPENAVFTVLFTDPSKKETVVTVQRTGDELAFKIPTFNLGNSYRGDAFSFQMRCNVPALTSIPVTSVTIQTKPDVSWTSTETTSFPTPANPTVRFSILGGPPYSIESTDGSVQHYLYVTTGYTTLFVPKTGDYGIKSISNACFMNPSPTKVRLNVANESPATPYISVNVKKPYHCATDTLELDIRSGGNFDASNAFLVEGSVYGCCDFKTLSAAPSNGKLRFVIPGLSLRSPEEEITLRVSSTSPVVHSRVFVLDLAYPINEVKLRFPGQIDTEPLITLARPVRGIVEVNDQSLQSLVISDGKKDSTVIFPERAFYYDVYISPKVGDNVYTIKSITSVCGTKPVNVSQNVHIMPYRIDYPVSYDRPYVCTGSDFYVPFLVTESARTNATFEVQLLKGDIFGKYSVLSLPSRTASNGIVAAIPDTVTAGDYFIRVASSDGAYSLGRAFKVKSPPSAIITAPGYPENQPITVTAGERLDLRIFIKGSTPVRVIADGLDYTEYDYPELAPTYYPTRNTDYTIKSLSNGCGDGKVSNSVRVLVPPQLTGSVVGGSFCKGPTMPVQYALKGEADLTDTYIYFELQNRETGVRYILDSTRTASGTIQIPMLPAVKGGWHKFQVTAPKYGLVAESDILLKDVPEVVLSGSTTINAGSTVNLSCTAAFADQQWVKYQLSDGSSGQFYSSSKENLVKVSPKQTTTYSIVSVSNACGNGKASGQATVTVNAPADRTVNVTGVNNQPYFLTGCVGDSIRVNFTTTGTFSAQNRFTVQISDPAGTTFTNIGTGTRSPITAFLPTDLARSNDRRIRVIASDPGAASGYSPDPLGIRFRATAKFNTDIVHYQDGTAPRVVVLLGGDGPWNYIYAKGGKREYLSGALPQDTITLEGANAGDEYILERVSNVCGDGTIQSPSTVRIEVISAVENAPVAVTVFPNPASDAITISNTDGREKSVEVFNTAGILILKKTIHGESGTIDIRLLPAGNYILKIGADKRASSFRVLKY
nr:T9SS type A sorting domain-containing protein [uncultured Dyadobacter sp.]